MTRKCRICLQPYDPLRAMQPTCNSFECQVEYASRVASRSAAKRMAVERKALKVHRDKLKTRSQWLKEAQVEFNRYIRERDRELPCISCGRFHTGSYDAGHYRSVGAASHLRFNEDNCHRQCVPCNQHKSGNVVEYRIQLCHRIGVGRVESLEASNGQVKWSIEDAKRIKAEYKAKLKALKAENESVSA